MLISDPEANDLPLTYDQTVSSSLKRCHSVIHLTSSYQPFPAVTINKFHEHIQPCSVLESGRQEEIISSNSCHYTRSPILKQWHILKKRPCVKSPRGEAVYKPRTEAQPEINSDDNAATAAALNLATTFPTKDTDSNYRCSHREREREREAETQAEGEAGSMHREPDVGFDPGSPGSRPGPKAGAKLLRHPGIPRCVW
ncbi:uncharacterized protein LOC144293759 isoform X2 [Canis aureus]